MDHTPSELKMVHMNICNSVGLRPSVQFFKSSAKDRKRLHELILDHWSMLQKQDNWYVLSLTILGVRRTVDVLLVRGAALRLRWRPEVVVHGSVVLRARGGRVGSGAGVPIAIVGALAEAEVVFLGPRPPSAVAGTGRGAPRWWERRPAFARRGIFHFLVRRGCVMGDITYTRTCHGLYIRDNIQEQCAYLGTRIRVQLHYIIGTTPPTLAKRHSRR